MRSPRSLGWFACLFAASSLGCAKAPQAESLGEPRVAPPIGDAQIRVLQDVATLALRGPVVDAKPGDYVLEHDGFVAVVSKDSGALVDFGPEGGFDELVAIAPTLFDANSTIRTEVVRISVEPSAPGVLHVTQRAGHLGLLAHTFMTFRKDVFVIETAVTHEDPSKPEMAIGVGERVGWGNAPTWLEGRGFMRREGGTFTTKFLGREGREVSYALSYGSEASVVRLSRPYLAGYFAQARSSAMTLVGDAEGRRRTVFLRASDGSIGRAASGLFDGAAFTRVAGPKLPPGGTVEVVRCAENDEPRKPFARFDRGEEILAPAGCHEARLWAPGAPEGSWVPLDEVSETTLGPTGKLAVVVTSGGERIPARVQVRGVSPTKDPDWGEDPDDGTALNVVQTPNGLAVRTIAPGTYRVIVDRGLEYSVHDEIVEVRARERTQIAAEISRVVDTRGYFAADLHLHAAPSPDAPQSLEDRVISLASSGVEVGVATDHNRVTDYGPAILATGLREHVAAIVGDEVTTEDTQFGHFNVFPMLAGQEPIAFSHTTPGEIIRTAKKVGPLGEGTIVQVNHPRMGDIGYFEAIRLDRNDVPGFMARSPELPLRFDAIEIFNGDDLTNTGPVEDVIRDWVALEKAGVLITATGNSDSHRAIFHEPGMPRTYVRVKNDTIAGFDENEFVASIRSRAAIVTSGPFVRLDVDGKGPGEYVEPGLHTVRIEVDAAPFVDVATIELMKSGKVVEKLTAPFPESDHRAVFETQLELAAGDSLVAIVSSPKEIEVMFRRGILPFAFTNSVRVGARVAEP